jgi:hypothetical protein
MKQWTVDFGSIPLNSAENHHHKPDPGINDSFGHFAFVNVIRDQLCHFLGMEKHLFRQAIVIAKENVIWHQEQLIHQDGKAFLLQCAEDAPT